jgi:DNA sulfur modification protein DndB
LSESKFATIISGDEIKTILRKRASKLNVKTISATTPKLLAEKVSIAEQEGWKKDKRNKKSYRVTKEKPLDEQLEDEIWCITAQMGYKELSRDRNFEIAIPKDPNPRQIDVFAKDDEVALVIECTQSAKPIKKKMSPLIDKISSFKGEVIQAIRSHYGRDAKLKPKFVIATRNIEWGDADLEKCKAQGISVLTEVELDYYKAITKHLKSAARYQFHAHLFAEMDIPALSKEVHAMRGTMGNTTFYNFLVEPMELLKISYVGHKASRSIDDLETYQRMLQPKRLRSIAKFLNEGGKFPTNVVVNIKTKKGKRLNYTSKAKKGEAEFGTLTLPNKFASAWVIDGQHRLYGYAYRELEGGPKKDDSVLSVLAFENLPAKDEMDMFIDINSKQVKVQKSLLVELYADLHWNSPEPSERLLALQSRIVARLNSQKTSPIYDRIVVTGTAKTTDRCLTQTSISDGLQVANLIGTVKKEGFQPGPLAHQDPANLDSALKKASTVLSAILELFKATAIVNWELGDRPGGYLCTNIGIRALLLVVSDICSHVSLQNQGISLSTYDADDLIDEISKYLVPVVAFFGSASTDQVQAFRNQGSSLAAVKRQSMGMNVHIQSLHPGYQPAGLQDYIDSRNQEGKEEAMLMITAMQERIFKFTLTTLKEKYGDLNEDWWIEGIPVAIQQNCTKDWVAQKQEGHQSSYLHLIHYFEIAYQNWDEFQVSFGLGEKDAGNKKLCLAWITKLSKIRNKTHHPEKEPITKEEIDWVRSLSMKIEEFVL